MDLHFPRVLLNSDAEAVWIGCYYEKSSQLGKDQQKGDSQR